MVTDQPGQVPPADQPVVPTPPVEPTPPAEPTPPPASIPEEPQPGVPPAAG